MEKIYIPGGFILIELCLEKKRDLKFGIKDLLIGLKFNLTSTIQTSNAERGR